MRPRNLIIALGLVTFTLFFQSQPILAYSCIPGREVLISAIERSESIIVGKLIWVERIARSNGSYKMTVEKSFKGNLKLGEELEFVGSSNHGGDGLWGMDEQQIGNSFLLYLGSPTIGYNFFGGETERFKGRTVYQVGNCTRSTGVKWAVDDLHYFEKFDKVKGKTRIYGRVFDKPYGSGLSEIEIKIISAGDSRVHVIKTEQNGLYEIYNLPAGDYYIDSPLGMKRYLPNGGVFQYASPNNVKGNSYRLMEKGQIELNFVHSDN